MQPFYLPQEFSIIIITPVYIPLDANGNTTFRYLHSAINKQQNNYSQAAYIRAGNFNQVVLPNSNIKFTWCGNILDKVYSNIKLGFKSTPLPHFDQSDHVSISLEPTYTHSGEKVNLPSGLSRCGQKELLCSSRITLEGPIETFLINQTWKHIPQLYFKLYNKVSTLPPLINMSGYILTRNHG